MNVGRRVEACVVLLLVMGSLAWTGRSEDAPAAKRPFILLTNDDGIDAPGLKAILEELERLGEVLVVAPSKNWSGASQSLELDDPVHVKVVPREASKGPTYSVDGPPATCVLLALEHLAKGRRIDLAVSGINKGENVGIDISCSGTVGAARMAADLGIPAIALSLAYGSKELPAAAERSAKLVAEALKQGLAGGVVLNVNFPRGPAAMWNAPVIAQPGGRGFVFTHKRKPDADGSSDLVFKPDLALAKGPFPEGSDARALAEGHVTITPLAPQGVEAEAARKLVKWSFFR